MLLAMIHEDDGPYTKRKIHKIRSRNYNLDND